MHGIIRDFSFVEKVNEISLASGTVLNNGFESFTI
jgi:hypothetical protein